ncbi:methyltransferase domain-containing protein [Roseovarius spongiae]|uniref:Methyltransferase domain-containing protein n=1 Tax=Roseovarius spongiae TaxID=2320272 RepID=A0A3A8B387_9RHOB|nr:methyltransferase domain-containing protein [Roseovarius spongiae]RKF14952.1 methyltransferase domain-containing protein [Roseovarius spongiae]
MPDFDAFHRLERAGWADPATARDYATRFAEAADQCVPALVSAVGAGPGCEALDLCCGHGNVACGLHAAGARVTGLDFSPAMLDLARDAVPGATFIEGDAMAAPFDDAMFDAVTIGFGVPHIPHPGRTFAEAARVLRPDGRIAYSVWQGGAAASVFTIVFGAIAEHGDPSVALPPGPGAHDYADEGIATDALTKAGFARPRFRVAPATCRVDAPDAPVDFFLEGTVRGGALLRPQPKAARALIRRAVADRIRAIYGPHGPWTVDAPAVIVSATLSPRA